MKAYQNEQPELHLFIIWNNGESYKERILNDIASRFSIKLTKKITWKKELFTQSLRRFYGKNLPANSNKENECGIGSFIIAVVEDKAPIYAPRRTNQGVKIVNVNMFDSKEMYRKWAKSNVIHATNSIIEANHDITLLLGISPADMYDNGFNIKTKDDKIDLAGAEGWESIEQMFYILNHTVQYVILRNFENLPHSIDYGEHSDIDILCENIDVTKLVLNSSNSTNQKARVQQIVKIENKTVNIDLRHIGDGYLDDNWEKSILVNRVFNTNGFYMPDKENYLYSMIYHALIQKSVVSCDYVSRTKELCNSLGIKDIDLSDEENALIELNAFLLNKKYKVVEPKDPTVAYNYYKLNGPASILRKWYKLKKDVKLLIKGRMA